MTIKEMLAAQSTASPPPAQFVPIESCDPMPIPLPRLGKGGENPLANPRQGYLVRQDGTETIPDAWDAQDISQAKGCDLIVVVNPHQEAYLAVRRPTDGHFVYLMGPMDVAFFPY